MASVLEKIRALDEQKKQLLDGAKKEALDKANAAIEELRELGFEYRLVEGGGTGGVPSPARTGGRRTGIREVVLQMVKEGGSVSRAHILQMMGAKGDTRAEQSISNALAALKKAGALDLTDGMYKAV